MNSYLQQLSGAARLASQQKKWPEVKACARKILGRSRDNAEGHFLLGLADKGLGRFEQASTAFRRAISSDDERYDAAVELAAMHVTDSRHDQAVTLLALYETKMQNSPLYLDMAGTLYMNVGLPDRALALFEKANELQPGIDLLQANLAACCVFVGKIDEAAVIYRRLLDKHPHHQRYHYELSRLSRAVDAAHVDEMRALLRATKLPPEKNIYAYYAIGKELEDLQRWDEAFEFLERAGSAAASVSGYDVQGDIDLIDQLIETCNAGWLAESPIDDATEHSKISPIFVVGLPRTGTTLTERILSSHSEVDSIGETFFMQIVIKQESKIRTTDSMNAAIIEAASQKHIQRIATAYRKSIDYKLGDKPNFLEKFPENFLYLGFIAKAFPDARIVHLTRNPMDSCFAMFKQSFFRYAYTLDDLGRYYAAYRKLHDHWRDVLGDRIIEVAYEALVSDQENETRQLLERLGLTFEDACLHFERNQTASNTASTVQIREKMHNRSVLRWKRFERQLEPLKEHLLGAGIDVE